MVITSRYKETDVDVMEEYIYEEYPKMETTQMAINNRMAKQIGTYCYNGTQ